MEVAQALDLAATATDLRAVPAQLLAGKVGHSAPLVIAQPGRIVGRSDLEFGHAGSLAAESAGVLRFARLTTALARNCAGRISAA
jgi:hypothetical protein